jgi:hypothetical protein
VMLACVACGDPGAAQILRKCDVCGQYVHLDMECDSPCGCSKRGCSCAVPIARPQLDAAVDSVDTIHEQFDFVVTIVPFWWWLCCLSACWAGREGGGSGGVGVGRVVGCAWHARYGVGCDQQKSCLYDHESVVLTCVSSNII